MWNRAIATASRRSPATKRSAPAYDPAKISLREIFEIFFVIHDATSLNLQGNDAGPQYRSGIYFSAAEQKQLGDDLSRQVSRDKLFGKSIFTKVLPLENRWPVEHQHQDFFEHNPN